MPRCHAPRRFAALATAVVVVVLVATPALAGTGQRAKPGGRVTPQVSVVITSVSPDFARRKGTVTVCGTIGNANQIVSTQLKLEDVSLAVSKTAATVSVGNSSDLNVTLTSANGFSDQFSFACMNLPAGMNFGTEENF